MTQRYLQEAAVGGMVQWLERWSWPVNFTQSALDLQLMGDH